MRHLILTGSQLSHTTLVAEKVSVAERSSLIKPKIILLTVSIVIKVAKDFTVSGSACQVPVQCKHNLSTCNIFILPEKRLLGTSFPFSDTTGVLSC